MGEIYIGDGDNVAQKIKGAYIGVNGIAQEVKKVYVGDENGIARLCWVGFEPDPIFENNSWKNIALACQLKAVPDTWVVGNQKTMNVNGRDYTINIIGKNHDDYADGSGKAPLTFQLHDLYIDLCAMNWKGTNEGGWSECDIRKDHLPVMLQLMPKEVQESIKEVAKITSEGDGSYGLMTTFDKLFLLSEKETRGTTTSAEIAEGLQYEYYKTGGRLRKKMVNSYEHWWLRSPYTASSSMFLIITHEGNVSGYSSDYEAALAPAFCF